MKKQKAKAMKTETTTNKKTNWSEKDAFLEERGKTLLTVLDDVRSEYENSPEFYYIRWGILRAFNSINEIRESMFGGDDGDKAGTEEKTVVGEKVTEVNNC